MIPIHELLNRIRWDKEFGNGQFEIGYYDRYEHTLHRIALRSVSFSGSGDQQSFELTDESGQTRRIPLHRIRELYRDGSLIWRRAGQGDLGDEQQ